MNYLKICSFLFLLINFLPNYSLTQSNNDFWEKVGEYPVFSQHDVTRNVLDYDTRRYVQKKETIYNTFHGFVLNSKGVMLGYKQEGTHARNPNFEPGVLFRSTDSGKTWKNISNKIPDIYPKPKNDYEKSKNAYRQAFQSISVMDSIFFILQGTNITGFRFLKSLDNGNTWILVSVNEVSPLVSISSNKSCSKIEDDLLITSNFYQNSTFSGGSIVENTSADHGKTWKNVTDISVNNIIPNDKDVFWRMINERTWVKKQDWLNQHPNHNNLEQLYTTPIYITMEASYKNTLYKLVEPKAFYPSRGQKLPKELIQSTDKGKTWKKIDTDGALIQEIKLVDCNNTVYATLNKASKGLYRSTNEGKTWELLKGIPNFPLFGANIQIGSDGHLYVGVERVIYKSKDAVCCHQISGGPVPPVPPPPEESETPTAPAPNLAYGTTIITDGSLLHPPIAGGYNTWIEDLATNILDIAGKGNIHLYVPQKRKFEIIKSIGTRPEEGEQILIFDWHTKALWLNSEAHAYTAAEELFLAIMQLDKSISLKDMHFIGYDRGNYVNSFAIKRLFQFKHKLPIDFSVDQLTMLVPTDYIDDPRLEQIKTWKGIGFTDIYISDLKPKTNNLYQEKPVFSEGTANAAKKIDSFLKVSNKNKRINISENTIKELERLSGHISPKGLDEGKLYTVYNELNDILSADSPYAKDFVELTSLLNAIRVLMLIDIVYQNWDEVHAIEITPSKFFEWKGLNPYEICRAYANTVKSSRNNGGYHLSRLRGGQELRPTMAPYSESNAVIELFDFKKFGLFNGSFIYASDLYGNLPTSGIPAWEVYGGQVNIQEGNASIKKGGILLHDPFYVPQNANSLSLKIKTQNVNTGSLAVDFLNQDNDIILTKILPIEADFVKFVERQIDITSIQESIVSMSLFFHGKPFDENKEAPIVFIDDVVLQEAKVINQKSTDNKIQQIGTQATAANENIQIGIKNGTFETMNSWTASSGQASVENETVALEPDKKNQAMTFTQQTFKVPENTNFLHFLIQKSKLTKADIKVQIKDVSTGETAILYNEEIRISALGKINSELSKFNEALDSGTLDVYKKEFEQKQVNISKYQGKVVELSFIYLSLRKSCPKIFIDDVRLSP